MDNPIPFEYGRTYIALMPRDPCWMFSYWEVQPQTLAVFRKQFGAESVDNAKPVLRVFEVPPPGTNGADGLLRYELRVSLEARNWYVSVEDPGRTWYVELGLVAPNGTFILLARSNRVRLPLGRVSEVTDARWMMFREGSEALIDLSGADRVGQGSLEMARQISFRWESTRGLFSWPAGSIAPVLLPRGGKKE